MADRSRPSPGRLAGKRVLVTGAAAGLGGEIAVRVAAEGAAVACIDIDVDRGRAATSRIVALGGDVRFIPGDVLDPASVVEFIAAAAEAMDGLDTVINNVGSIALGTIEDTPEEEWDQIMALNVKSVYLVSRQAVPRLREAGRGSIVNIASGVGLRSARNMAAYGAAKAAVVMLTKNMALDFAREQIRVNCVCPGMIDTELSRKTIAWQAARAGIDPEEARAQHSATYPMRRLGEPSDVAPAAVYLASDEASWVTGTTLAVDGGRSAGTA